VWLFRNAKRLRAPDRDETPGPDAASTGAAARTYLGVVRPALIFLTLAWLAYPKSADVYLYLQHGLIASHGLDPYAIRAGDFDSPLSPLLMWKQSSAYGPVAVAIFAAAARALPFGVPAAVYTYKFYCLAAHLLNGYLVWKGLSGTRLRSRVALAYLVNPMLLIDQVANGHVEVFLNTSLIVLILCLKWKYQLGCIWAILTGLMTKIVPIVWLPLYAVFLVRSRKWGDLATAAAQIVATVLGLSFTVITTRQSWLSLLHTGAEWMAAGSIHDIFNATVDGLHGVLPDIVTQKRAGFFWLFKLATSAAYCLIYAAMLWRLYYRRQRDAAEDLLRDLGWATLALFLLAAPWYQPWYATILVPFVALNLNARYFAVTAMTFVTTSSLAYHILAYSGERLPLLAVSLLTVVPTAILVALGVLGKSPASASHGLLDLGEG
jgi:alpha-1,6-mannosyltransferase